jgi:hypothetical protein
MTSTTNHLCDGKWYFFHHTNFRGRNFGPAKTVSVMIIWPTETFKISISFCDIQ